MQTIITYMAEDGEEFFTPQDCLRYEEKILNLPDCVEWRDVEGKRLYPHGIYSIDQAYGETETYIIRDTPTWKEEIKFFKHYYGYVPDEQRPGVYHWSHEKQKWILEEA